MDKAVTGEPMESDQNQRISDAIRLEWHRLRNFIRKRVADPGDAEDILQEVFSELIEAYRLMSPIGQVGAWLFRVARNRITDRFRKKKTETPDDLIAEADAAGVFSFADLIPSRDAGPDALYVRRMLIEELEEALNELPQEQREVFLAHEVEGKSFRDLAAETGQSINTLLSRKHYAVRHLRRRLQDIYQEFR